MDQILGDLRIGSAIEPDRDLLLAPLVCTTPLGTVLIKGEPRMGPHRGEELAEVLLDNYLGRRLDVLSDLRGPFAIAIIPARNDELLIGIDRMGIQRLAYRIDGNRLVFGSSALEVARRFRDKPKLNPNAFYAFMYAHMVPSPITAFDEVNKLYPASAVQVSRDGANIGRYWEPNYARATATAIPELRSNVQPTIRRAIEALAGDEPSGTFLSGGLDSSTVTGLLADLSGKDTKAFSVGFGIDDFDEMEFARASSEHFGCEHFIREITADDIVAAVPMIASAYDEPFGNSSAVPTLICAQLAAENGVTHLYAGDGGDELFGGNERYVRQQVFEYYQRIPRALRSGLLWPLANRLDPESGWLPLQKFSSYVHQASIPLPERFESWNLVYREGADTVFSRDFLQSVDLDAHFQHMKSVWEACESDDLLDRMLHYDWKFILADNDLRKVTTMCELAGVRVSYPMLDEDLVDLSLQIPSREKISGRDLRTFFKAAVRDLLPAKIITKEKHGFSLPFGQWLKEHRELRELVFSSLDSLGERNLFNRDFVRKVADEHREGHASYYGYAIWDLLSIEQWLKQHADEIDADAMS